MRLIHAIFMLLLVMLGLLVWLMAVPEPTFATGGTHAMYPAMNSGGDGLARLGAAINPIGLLGSASFLMMVLLTALGVREARRDKLFCLLMTGVGLIAQCAWWAMYSSYLGYLRSADLEFAFGFPVPTSWMLFGIWLTGALFCVFYVLGFRRFILTEADEAVYETLRTQAEVPRAPHRERGSN